MLKLAFTKYELENLLDVLHFTPMQRRIIKYRMDEESRVEMAELEIKDIAIKIQKAYDSNLIVF